MINTRSKSHGRAPANNDVLATETLTERRVRWSNLVLRQHYQPVITEVLDGELPKYTNSTTVNTADRVSIMRECILILASAPLVLIAAMNGTLVKQIRSDANLQMNHALIQDRARSTPSIYLHQLADEYGISPTPHQYMAIRDLVHDYLAVGIVSEHARYIDSITPPTVSPSVSSDHRKYLHIAARSPARVSTLSRLCRGIEQLFLETPQHLRNAPMRFPPGECGYSKSSHVRLAQHRAHQSSNCVMNLVEDICTYLHATKRFKQHFRMHQFIIYPIFRPEQAAIAEIFCSGLLQVWVDSGGGFNAYPAGLSVASARRVSVDDWKDHERWVKYTSPVEGNISVQRERAEEWAKALAWADEEEVGGKTAEGMEKALEQEDVYADGHESVHKGI